MDNLKRVWAPRTVPQNKQMLLAVAGSWPMTAGQHRLLMEDKILALFQQAGPEEARSAMEMSEESFPELATIAQHSNREHWPDALMMSDTMGMALGMIDWDKEGPVRTEVQLREIREQLQEQTLRSLIESL